MVAKIREPITTSTPDLSNAPCLATLIKSGDLGEDLNSKKAQLLFSLQTPKINTEVGHVDLTARQSCTSTRFR